MVKKEKSKGGRPPKFTSVEQVQKLIDKYFKECDKKKKPYTITGLALALDTTRDVIIDYEKKDEYSNTIKKAKQKCEQYSEEQLYRTSQVAGVIFSLKNNYGWKDKLEHDHTTAGKELPQPIIPVHVPSNNSNSEGNGAE